MHLTVKYDHNYSQPTSPVVCYGFFDLLNQIIKMIIRKRLICLD